MMKYIFFILLIFVIFFSACPTTPVIDDVDSLEECFSDLAVPDQPDEIESPNLISETEELLSSGIVCTVKTYEYAPGAEESLLLDPTSDVIYPGSILKAGSVVTGEYTPIDAPRTPITISRSETNGAVTIDDPELSTVRAAVFELSQNDQVQVANIVADITEIHSEEHLRLSINGNFNSMNTSIDAAFDWGDSNINSRFLVQFHQVYYSIDVNPITNPLDWFQTESPDFCLNLAHMPMYVASVKYGRVGMLMFESTAEASYVNAAFNASFGNENVGGGIDVEGEHQEVWSSSTFKLLIAGGSSEDAVRAVNDIDGFNDWILNGGEYSTESPGSPIAYSLRFLDGGTAKIVKSGEYQV